MNPLFYILIIAWFAGLTTGIMSFTSGGILYLTFQDIASQAKIENAWKPRLGAILGFAIGMIGHKLLG